MITQNETAGPREGKPAAPNERNKHNSPRREFQAETLADLRAQLPRYLRALGVDLTEKGGKLIGRCPNPDHDDARPSFAILRNGRTCGCFPCDFCGDVFALAQWLGKARGFVDSVKHVAAVLGVRLPDDEQGHPQAATRAAKPMPRPKPEPPKLSPEQVERIAAARLRFCDALHAGEPIIADIAASLGLQLKTLQWAARGACGLALDGPAGLPPWLCYAYASGLKYRNPGKSGPRFVWLCGRALAPWRMGWAARPEAATAYLSEGESDALALVEAGLEADGRAACVAAPGTSFPREWAPLFRGKRVVLCFDTDGPGTQAAATVAATLKGHAREILRWKGPRPQ